MNRKRFTFIGILPYIIFFMTIAIVIFVGYTMFEDYKKSMNPSGNDSSISMSLETTSGTAYIGDERIEVSISGKNYGALSCSSTDNKIASCGIHGTTLIVKPESKAGEAVIVVKEASGNNTIAYEMKVLSKNSANTEKEDDKQTTTGTTGTVSKPTSSLSLSYSYGTIYVGKDATLIIRGSNYGTLSCSSSNTTVATCSISGTKLLITPKTVGNATITVKGTSGKSATYKATVAKQNTTTNNNTTNTTETNFYLVETKGVTSIGGTTLTTTIKGNNYGTITCSTNDRNVAICGVNGTEVKITPQTKSGTVTLTIKESKNNKTATYIVTVLPKGVTEVPTLTLNTTSGTTKGSILTATISGTNYGKLTCSSSSNAIATCKITNNTLSITPIKDGEATITVKEATAGITATYKVTVKYEYECLDGTLTNDTTYGTICITPGYETEQESCSKYGTPIVYDEISSIEDTSYVTESETMECKLNPEPFSQYDKYICVLTIKNCEEYNYTTVYTCPKGWSTYSGSNTTLQCYKSASVKK